MSNSDDNPDNEPDPTTADIIAAFQTEGPLDEMFPADETISLSMRTAAEAYLVAMQASDELGTPWIPPEDDPVAKRMAEVGLLSFEQVN